MTETIPEAAREKIVVGEKNYAIFRVDRLPGIDQAAFRCRPLVQKIILENIARNFNEKFLSMSDLVSLANGKRVTTVTEVPFYPARILLQDFTGVPVLVDLASMRSAAKREGLDPAIVDSAVQIDLIIDHSVQVDAYGSAGALAHNIEMEYHRNGERYALLKWAQTAFPKLHVVPPGNGICHQVNLEYLATVVSEGGADQKSAQAYPDTVIGTDSHTTMINGLGVLGWGVGGIEAEAVMLGEPYMLQFPQVIGVRLDGELKEGVTATDLVLTVTKMMRKEGVVGKFVEFYGPGLATLSVQDRATISNMCPEYGATSALFPIDESTITYLSATGRSREHIELVRAYALATGFWHDKSSPSPEVEKELKLDLGTVLPTMSGPKNPEEAHPLPEVPATFSESLKGYRASHPARNGTVDDGRIAIAAITSCTNTSNPFVMIGAGLMAKKAIQLGLSVDPFVKASLAPGSRVVSSYLESSGLVEPLAKLGFSIVGYGCTTCIGNSGPLSQLAETAVKDKDAFVVAVLSGNRNFEARVHNEVRANYLASPMLVVAAALAGRIDIDLSSSPLGVGRDGKKVYLKDIWPASSEINATVEGAMKRDMFSMSYSKIYDGGKLWDSIKVMQGLTYSWEDKSTYLREVPFFERPKTMVGGPADSIVEGARILALLGDNVSTDHISPAGEIPVDSPAGAYLIGHGVKKEDFNTYGSRRGNHDLMARGTFANTRLKNYMVKDKEGGYSVHFPSGRMDSIFGVAEEYKTTGTPLVVLAGKRYGQGSSRDWAAKGPRLLGVKAVIAESYERIHRSNLAGMGVLPFEFTGGEGWKSLGLTGEEVISLVAEGGKLRPSSEVEAVARSTSGAEKRFRLRLRLESQVELDYFRDGGVLRYAFERLLSR